MPFVRGKYIFDVSENGYHQQEVFDVVNTAHDFLEKYQLSVCPVSRDTLTDKRWFVMQTVGHTDPYDRTLPVYFTNISEAYQYAFERIEKILTNKLPAGDGSE